MVPDDDWHALLRQDLAAMTPEVFATQGRLTVPLPTDRRATDWERGTAGLETSRWITADLTVRRAALRTVGGFDERFRRAYREDVDLALRLVEQVGPIGQGRRHVAHPVRPADGWASLRAQAGNADDMLMLRRHGPGWRTRVGAPRGRRREHLLVTGGAVVAVGAILAGRRPLAAAAGLAWLAGTGRFAWQRIAPGPRTPHEVRRMALTSAVIPFAAIGHTLRGLVRHRGATAWVGPPELVLFDRDGTLVEDVAYNGDPERVTPVPGVAGALQRLRAAGVRLGIVTNQSGVARGFLDEAQAEAVTKRVADLLGPFDVTRMCPHGPEDECACRKPAPGLILDACAETGIAPVRTVVIGDTAADVGAAQAAGATGILVPNSVTRAEEVAQAARTATVAADLGSAVDLLLSGVAR